VTRQKGRFKRCLAARGTMDCDGDHLPADPGLFPPTDGEADE
jgi:hypothetical protein